MQAAAALDTGDELPSMLWGLDPLFSAFVKLYVKDVLQMKESYQVPGIYFYKSHPIFKVDVLGTVVYKREREDFFNYGVDDGTGVINCLCWKNDPWREHEVPAGDGVADGTFSPVAELRKLREAQQSSRRLEIGDVLRVRGPVKTSRQQREITASTFYKVNDPVMAVQIAWMTEVPQLYRQFYDKPVELGPSFTGSATSCLTQAVRILKDFFKEKTVTRFRPYDIQDLLEPLVSRQHPTGSSDEEPVATQTPYQQLTQLLKEALQLLQDEGTVFRKVRSQDEVYNVTEMDNDLIMAVKDIIREDCKKDKYMEKGCHILHILSAVRQRYSLNVSRVALQLVLKSLECKSDIISPSESYYTII